ncbi:WW domain-containing protein [Abeliophyllum distichum]|uniref:WW domain-containing protein n=1 Tax=Abeliophyllum distichum TaxID=126358 RepID=A0ABD1QK92_9LAMI
MGRRKERRHAAMSASGRRVKLDLFAEPSGDLGASSAQDKVGENGDSENHAGLPNSPSSSGQQPGNPLLLLEQYSDDELDEDSSERQNRAVGEDPSVDIDGQTKIAAGKETGDIENSDGNESSVPKLEQLVIDHDSTQNPLQKLRKDSENVNDSDDLDVGTNPAEEVTYPVVSDAQVVGDVSTGWKVVLHEESNQYYYWNITTGETSWEVPDDLAQVTDANCLEKAAAETEEKGYGLVGTSRSSIPLDVEHGDSTTWQLNGGSDANCKTSCGSEQGAEMHGYGEVCNGDSVDKEKGNQDADQNNETSLLANTLLGNEIASSTKINHGRHSEEYETGTDLSFQLMKHCESLLERLNSMKGLSCHLQACDLISKYALEVEIRLADIKALTYHGSLLLPFWLHSKGQLKQLEAAIDDVIPQYNSAPTSEVEGTSKSFEGIGDAVDSSEKKPLFPIVVSQASEYAAHDSYFKSYGDGAITAGHVPSSEHLTAHSGNGSGGKSEVGGLAIHSELTPNTVLHSGEEVDMDVDMEVEDTIASAKSPIQDASGAESHLSSKQSNLHNPLADQEFTVPGQTFSVPPPPPDDDLEYYGQTNTELSGAGLYTHPEGGHVAVSHLPQYYDSVSNVFGAAPFVVNPVEPAAYLGLQNGTVNSASLVSDTAVESSGIHGDTIQSIGSETAGSFDAHAEMVPSLLPKMKADVLAADQVTVRVSGFPDSQHYIEAPATTSNTQSVSVPSTSSITTTIVSGATSSKVQSKVSRSKKRTASVVSTLRSSKKVSSLVDKWKAAKEELHEEEEEEEPENAYEMLEKKRQREIEKWRAQQIASGEAKDNANFQPLGGDWRERVKRRRSQKMNDTEKSESDAATEGNQQPDLAALSRGLPSGWQVYWDDSSKQVYYGNALTSETTWIRPTD